LPEELQKDPLTRGQFLWFGALGTFTGIALTVPPAIFVLDPSIKSVLQERSDVPAEWKEVGSVFEIPAGEVVEDLVEFTQKQTYDAGQPKIDEVRKSVGTIPNAVLLSWRDGKLPDVLSDKSEGPLPEADIRVLERDLNVLSNHCAHLGCPVRWVPEDRDILCPCHGGIYDINGDHTGGPPAHGLWHFVSRIDEDGTILVKHEFYVQQKGQIGPGVNSKPYVV
jgi:Rieske Fe-S protein